MLFATLLLAAGSASVTAHMNIYHPSMYGWKDLVAGRISSNGGVQNGVKDWVGPMLNLPLSSWWFRGFSNLPTGGEVMALPAGGSVTIQHACHLAWTSYASDRSSTTKPGSKLDACPGNAGAYHSNRANEGDPFVDAGHLSGCALAIADVDDVHKANQNNMVVFSVNHKCIQQKMTSFQIPKLMPACTGKKCICAWLWTAANGTANFYHSGFDCKITNVSPNARKIGKPKTPKFVGNGGKAVSGPKTPLYTYNQGILPSRKIPWIGEWYRAGYHASWSFPHDGAQNDIFTGSSSKPKKSKKKGSKFVAKHTTKTRHRKSPRQLYTLEGVSDFHESDEQSNN